MRSSVESGADSRFKFQGKEYDTELSLNLYYFGLFRVSHGFMSSPPQWNRMAILKFSRFR